MDCYPRKHKISFINDTPQTSAFYNMDHERVFHLVLITLGIPFVISATTSYIFDFIQHDGGQFVEDFFCVLKMTMTSYVWNLDVHY